MAKKIETYRVCGWFKDGELIRSRGILNLSAVGNRKKVDDLAYATAMLHNDEGYIHMEGELTLYNDAHEPKEGETEVYIIVPRSAKELYLGFEPTFFDSWEEAEKRMFWNQEEISQKILQGIIQWYEPSAEVVRLAFTSGSKKFKPVDGWVYYITRDCQLGGESVKKGALYRYSDGKWTKYEGYKA